MDQCSKTLLDMVGKKRRQRWYYGSWSSIRCSACGGIITSLVELRFGEREAEALPVPCPGIFEVTVGEAG
jgi:hypothetical protein